MLEKNQPAPTFNLLNEKNEMINLSDFKDKKNIVLFFYPKDDTPGCTIEANQFTALADEFNKLETVIIGVSKDSCESHQAFIDKFNLNLMLLADNQGEVCEGYDVWHEKEKNGVKAMGIVRSTFIINKDGNLADVEYNLMPDGHPQAVLEKIRQL